MIVLGIDPGTAITGFAVLSCRGSEPVLVDCGVIRTEKSESSERRLLKLHSRMSELLSDHAPSDVAVEQLFFNTNVSTAIKVGQARGVVLLAAAAAGTRVGEYTPLQVKQAVVGYGRATKHQVQQMVKSILGLPEAPQPDDAADAVAVALCHAYSAKLNQKLAAAYASGKSS